MRLEYAVYAMGIGLGLAEYRATLHINARSVVGAFPFEFEVVRSSLEITIQEVAHEALTHLRFEHQDLWEHPSTYVSVQGLIGPFLHVVDALEDVPPLERFMTETISAYVWAHQSIRFELEETRRR